MLLGGLVVFFAELAGGDPEMLFINPAKTVGVAKAALVGNFRYGQVDAVQKLMGLF